MYDVKKMVEEIISRRKIKQIVFVGCGASLTCFYSPYYYILHEAKNLATAYMLANEFIHDTPKNIDENTIIVAASKHGDTPETLQALQVGKERGAILVGIAMNKQNLMGEICDYTIPYLDRTAGKFEEGRSGYALKIAYELLYALEGDKERYEKMKAAMDKMSPLIKTSHEQAMRDAIKFALEYKKDDIIYTIGSGTAYGTVHKLAIASLMESHWIHSNGLQSSDFFHGPLEITEADTAYILFKSSGKTEAVDDRVIGFLETFNRHLTVIDGARYGLKDLGDVSEYYDGPYYEELWDVYNEQLAQMRCHPLDTRKFMWKYKY